MKNITWAGVTSTTISANRTSDILNILHPDETGACIQLKWTGGVGTIKLQASNDGINWDDLDLMTDAVSGAGQTMWVLNMAYFKFMQVVYTFGSSTGTLTGTYNTKRNGGG